MRRIIAVLWLVAALFAAPVLAHHGWGSYDASKVMRFDAAPVEVRYRNPHAEITVDYRGQRWVAVLAPTSRMESRGLAEDALKVGKAITVEGYPRKDGTRELRAERIVVDGKTIELR
ncbi:DUF6152 family protein [Luteimonas sp. SX5]|uniref:DUF6152 family protein n=1 Tax=Luteimonas galliterrae TaxID=2940486 RepID=A0ABT0MHN7_9GAMM|nr:DUF6152 family protein [Luteimonas galliterrae]MCL1634193.1 DUF6152 family protein [Luteimonas galliterrae]